MVKKCRFLVINLISCNQIFIYKISQSRICNISKKIHILNKRFRNLPHIYRMRTISYIHQNKIYFSCWSRKGFAIFAALKREVCISRLSLQICAMALKKSARKKTIISDKKASEYVAPCVLLLQLRNWCIAIIGGKLCLDGICYVGRKLI